MLESSVGSQNRVVGLNDRARELRCRIHTELKLGLLAVVQREPFQKQSTETRASATAEGVEDEESLQTSAVICETSDLVHDRVDQLFSDSVMSTGI